MKPVALLSFFLALTACHGPAADDSAVCQDVIVRLCSNPRCEVVTQSLNVTNACIDELQVRTGCANVDFAFGENGAPTRERFLECRVPIIRAGDSKQTAPLCDDVSEAFDRCDDMVRFFKGAQP